MLSGFESGCHRLGELRRFELMTMSRYRLAMLRAEGAASEHEAMEIRSKAEAAHMEATTTCHRFRNRLPTALRKLTAGYELRTYCAHACSHHSPGGNSQYINKACWSSLALVQGLKRLSERHASTLPLVNPKTCFAQSQTNVLANVVAGAQESWHFLPRRSFSSGEVPGSL